MLASLFRRAVPAGRFANLSKTVLQIWVLWTAALWLVPQLIRRAEHGLGPSAPSFTPLPELGLALLVACSLAGLGSAWVLVGHGEGTPLPMDTTRRLVVTGPYGHVRNPMAITGVGQMISVGLLLGSPGVLLYSIAGALVWNYAMRPAEERDMARYFGASFEAYRRAVPCWIPRLKPYPSDTGA